MTVAAGPYYHWNSRSDWNSPPFNDCSPNLRQILGYCTHTFGGKTLGCHADRPVTGGTSMSSHAWGAALDYQPDGGNAEGRGVVAPFLISWSRELGINTIHDYVRQEMWKPGQGWVHANIGSIGGQWLHIETTPAAWGDGRSVQERISAPPPPPPPPAAECRPPYVPEAHDYGLYPFNPNKPALGPGFGYTNGTQQYQGFCEYANWVMRIESGGVILPCEERVWTIHSMAACQNVQRFFGLPVTGWMTLETWGVIDGLATNFGRPRV